MFKSFHKLLGTRGKGGHFSRLERRLRPVLEELEPRLLLTAVTYNNGPLLANVRVNAVYYGPDWSSSSTYEGYVGQLNRFLGDVVSSPYIDQIHEYSTSTTNIGRGSFWGADVSPSGWNPQTETVGGVATTVVEDSTITAMLSSEIANGHLPAPSANQLYVVYVAPNVVVHQRGGTFSNSFTQGFSGYHQVSTDNNGDTYYYAVIVDQTGWYPGSKPNGTPKGLTTLQYDTSVSSHELAEAVTDPDLTSGWRDYSTTGPTAGMRSQTFLGISGEAPSGR